MFHKKIIVVTLSVLLLTSCGETSLISSSSEFSSSASLSTSSSSSSSSFVSSSSFASSSLLDSSSISISQNPELAKYYGNIDEYTCLKKAELKTKLYNLVSKNTVSVSYDSLWEKFKQTDLREDGTIWDMYGDYHFDPDKDRAGNYSKPGDVFNKEHSVPKSWFNEEHPEYSDLWHLYPTDGKINGTRSNYMFGEVDDSVSLNSTLLGVPVGNREGNEIGKIDSKWIYQGITSGTTVFEPYEIYKGDFARTYFMMATRYQNRIGYWDDGLSFDVITNNGAYPSLTRYSINLFMTWAKEDPVSQKEIDRNNAVYSIQKNRNPFIDYPGLADLIWGDLYTVV